MQSVQLFLSNQLIPADKKNFIIQCIEKLKDADQREWALTMLSHEREHFHELAPIIWHSVGTIAALLQEIVSVYPLINQPALDQKVSNKACNVLALLQSVAAHKDTR